MAVQGQPVRSAAPDLDGGQPPVERACSLPLHASSLHDLAGPVNQVSTMLELFQKKYHDTLDIDGQAILELIQTSASRLQTLWRGIETYAGTAGSSGDYRRCDSGEILAAATARLEPAIRETNTCITCGRLPVVTCDPGQMALVFSGLIDNSIKFRTEAPPEIQVSAEWSGDQWRLSFRDNGIGIARKDAVQVFHLFKRLNGDRYPGAGVGLAIARHVVEQHGGRIWLDTKPGCGAQFFLTLPAAE